MAILSQNLISQLSKIREICENKATQKFPGIMVRVQCKLHEHAVLCEAQNKF